MLHVGKRSVFLLIWICFAGTAYSQSQCELELIGLVEDNIGEALPGATIAIQNTDTGVVSDSNGRFLLSNLCPGTYELLVRFVGFEDESVQIKVPVNRITVIKLRPSVKILHDLVIEGEHTQKHSASQSLSIITAEELVVSKGKTLGEMLQRIPGVTNIMSGPSVFKPVINGLHSQRVLILNNGIRQEGQQWGIDHAPEVDTYIASELEVVKGAETVRYGADAMGGVILINTSPLHHSPGVGGELNIAGASNNRMGALSGMIEGGLGKKSGIGLRVQGTLKKGGDYHAPRYNLSNTGTEERNASIDVGYKKNSVDAELYFSSFNTDIAILRSSHTGNLRDLQNSIVNNEPWYIADFTYDISSPRQKINHQLLKGKLKTKAGNGALTLLYGGQFDQRKEYDVRRDNKNIPGLSLELYTHAIDLTYDFGHGAWFGTIGINGTAKTNNNLTGLGLLPNYNVYQGGAFFFEKFKRNKWLAEFGLRLDQQLLKPKMLSHGDLLEPSFNFTYAAFSLGASVFLNPAARLSSNFGMTTRPPLVNELYSQGLHHGTAAIEEGILIRNNGISTSESDIHTEKSFKWVNSFQYQKGSVSFEINAFLNLFQNYIYLTPYDTRLTIRGFFPVFHYRQTDAILTGSDLSFDYQISKKLSYSVKASYVYAADRLSASNRLPFIPPADVQNEVSYSLPSFANWKELKFTVYGNIFFKQKRAPHTIYPEDIPDSPSQINFDFMDAPDTYFLLKADLSGSLGLGNRELNVSVGGENLLNTSYRNYMNRLRYFADETGINIFLRLNYKFHSHR